jgi:hypothetical protein
MPNSAAWIRNVAFVSGNHMNMQMGDRLACRFANVDADVEAVWCETLQDCLTSDVDRFRNGLAL